MAFVKKNFTPIGGQSARGHGVQVFAYNAGADALAAVKASGYFNAVSGMLNARDVVIVIASDGLFIGDIAAITAGVVTMTTADINAA